MRNQWTRLNLPVELIEEVQKLKESAWHAGRNYDTDQGIFYANALVVREAKFLDFLADFLNRTGAKQ